MDRVEPLFFPGTAAIDPEFDADSQYVLGLGAQLFTATVMLTLLAVALFVERLATRE